MYAVIDVETTGLSPKTGHRVVEIAVVQTGLWGEFQSQWTTVVDPGRDPGPTHIHGLTREALTGAPRFWELIPHLTTLLRGRTVVGHNLPFDWLFVTSEFEGARVPVPRVRGLDTMELAPSFITGAPRSLKACCSAAGINPGESHSALSDARATAQLLHSFLSASRPKAPSWSQLVGSNMSVPWPNLAPRQFTPVARSVSPPRQRETGLSGLPDAMPRIPTEPMADPYLALVDKCLVDRELTREERGELAMVAHDLGLKPSAVSKLHREYLLALARVALSDDQLTADEISDLKLVANLLGLTPASVEKALGEAATSRAKHASVAQGLRPGNSVCFTGEESLPKEVWEDRAIQAGLIVKSGVSKELTALVVAAGFEQTGKARQARGYELPVLTLPQFEEQLTRLRPAPSPR